MQSVSLENQMNEETAVGGKGLLLGLAVHGRGVIPGTDSGLPGPQPRSFLGPTLNTTLGSEHRPSSSPTSAFLLQVAHSIVLFIAVTPESTTMIFMFLVFSCQNTNRHA